MLEIERKFLVDHKRWNELNKPEGVLIVQGFLTKTKELVVRVRIKGEQAYLTLKGSSEGIVRPEYEYTIPLKDAEEMLALFTDKQIRKTRYEIMHAGKRWEVDVFEGKLAGLILAEIELQAEDEIVEVPNWVGPEVSDDPNYYNAVLVEKC